MNIKTYNPSIKNETEFVFYILSKGNNSGRPMHRPCANCFKVTCNNELQKKNVFNYMYLLWKASKFDPFIIGSVIPYLRIEDCKKVLFDAMYSKDINHHKLQHYMNVVAGLKAQRENLISRIGLLQEWESAFIHKNIRI